MIPDPNTITPETTHITLPTDEEHRIKIIDLDDYGTTYEITKPDSDRTLHITQVENDLIDMILYDKEGTTIASGTIFSITNSGVTPETFHDLLAICL